MDPFNGTYKDMMNQFKCSESIANATNYELKMASDSLSDDFNQAPSFITIKSDLDLSLKVGPNANMGTYNIVVRGIFPPS